ncbi:MAG: pentapeptide repeat-containing protein [Anaerolineae bacterium]
MIPEVTQYYHQLRVDIGRVFNLAELRTLVFDLGIDWDELAGDIESTKIESLIAYLHRRGRLDDLLLLLRQERPHVEWPSIPKLATFDLSRSDLSTDTLDEARLGKAQMYRADLSGTTLREANLSGANLSHAVLRETDLRRAAFYLADLSGADLRGANLAGAKLRKANLRDADLTGANLKNADLRLADLRGARVTAAQLARARKLRGAILPNGRLYNPGRPLAEQLGG